MFRYYKDVCDVVSLLVYCPSDKSYLLTKEINGEYWIPCSKAEKNCWKITAHKINFEIFGIDATSQCTPLRVYKIWLPNHPQACVYHAVYKVIVKSETKKRAKIKDNTKQGMRARLQWLNTIELDRQRAHATLRSPELAVFAQIASGEMHKNGDNMVDMFLGCHLQLSSFGKNHECENSLLVEICDDNIIIGGDASGGPTDLVSPNYQLLQAANYNREDQIRMYREFISMVYPALYMSPLVFTQFMLDLGWQRSQCQSLFRAADVSCRGGLSFLELILWAASLEPTTQHSGLPAEIRCRYIFRYFDSNRDSKLEYVEFKELVAAARAARQLPVDALSVARDSDTFLRQVGLTPNSQLPLAEFLRGVGELRLRGTSSLLRAPRSIAGYLVDLQERDVTPHSSSNKMFPSVANPQLGEVSVASAAVRRPLIRPDYNMATYTVRVRSQAPNEMLELTAFDEDAVSPSTARLVPPAGTVTSLEVMGPSTGPVEAIVAVHYFASAVETTVSKRVPPGSRASTVGKAPWSWASPIEEAALGTLLLKLAEAVRPICASEPRLLKLSSPVYTIGDLHGNLAALLAMEGCLWPGGAALAPATLLFLGDYVDRGPHGAELMAYLLAAKMQRPKGIRLVRGNHETRDIQKMFTFHSECISKYGETEGSKIWNAINQVFDVLPLAAVVDDKVFCCHGGIPPPWVCPLISAIDKVPVPLSRPAEQSTIAWELMWNDPIKPNKMTATLALELTANEGFAANTKRGTGHVFDQTALDRFLLANQLSHVVRAHELHQNGFMCQLRGRLVSVFSSFHYCGGTNDSGVALLEGGKLRLLRVTGDEV